MLKNQKLSFLEKNRSFLNAAVVVLITILFGTSCGNVKNLQYLQGPLDTVRLSKLEIPEARIQKGDLLGITVYSENPEATAAVTNAAPASAAGTGYLVDQRGNIQFFKLGILPVEGKTQRELSDTLTRLYIQDSLLRNPYVEVRFLNFKVTLLGEVNRPGPFSTPTDKVSVLDAVALAGDFTPFGRKDNVLVIRESNGKREFGHLDLGKPDVFLSPYYYLKQNDMIIVDVSKNKSVVNDQVTMRNISIGSTIISTVLVIYSVFRR